MDPAELWLGWFVGGSMAWVALGFPGGGMGDTGNPWSSVTLGSSSQESEDHSSSGQV